MSVSLASPCAAVTMPIADAHWRRFVALLLWKLAPGQTVTVTTAEVEEFALQDAAGVARLFTHAHGEQIDFRVTSQDEIDRLLSERRSETTEGEAA